MAVGAVSLVEDAVGWAVRHKNVGVGRDARVELRSNRIGDNAKSLSQKRRGRRAPELQPHNLNAFVDQERGVRDQRPPGGVSNDRIMIPRDDHAIGMWQLAKSLIEVEELFCALAVHGEIASMNQNIARWHLDFSVQLVRVRNQNDGETVGVFPCGRRLRSDAQLSSPVLGDDAVPSDGAGEA